MARRVELHEKLCFILGSRNVYFQPPETVKMKYPAIVYNLRDINRTNADDIGYVHQDEYTLTVIDRDPDSSIPRNILSNFSLCRFDRWYASDNLNHYVIDLFY